MAEWTKVADVYQNQRFYDSLVVFNNNIYTPTQAMIAMIESGLLYKLNSGKTAWEQVCGQYDPEDLVEYYSSAVIFEDRLYGIAENPIRLLRLNETEDAWEMVGSDGYESEYSQCAVVFDGDIYVGTYFNGVLLKFDFNTSQWVKVCDQYEDQEYIWKLYVFNDRLYGLTNGGISTNGYLLRLNDEKTAWEKIADPAGEGTFARDIAWFNDNVYLSSNHLYKLNEAGNAFTKVCDCPGTQEYLAGLVVYNERLYCTTFGDSLLTILTEAEDQLETVCSSGVPASRYLTAGIVLDETLYFSDYFGNLYSYTEPEPVPIKAVPSTTCFVKLSEDEMFVISKYKPDNVADSLLLVTDFMGNNVNGEDVYEDVFFN